MCIRDSGETFVQGGVWYQVYVDYALELGPGGRLIIVGIFSGGQDRCV